MINATCLRPYDWFMDLAVACTTSSHDEQSNSLCAAVNDQNLVRLFKVSAAVACSGVFLASILITLGWVFDCEALKDPLRYGGKVHSSVALAFILSALGLSGRSFARKIPLLRHLGPVLGLMVAAIGLLTLFENLSGLDLQLNHIWWHGRDDSPGIMFPGPMAPGV